MGIAENMTKKVIYLEVDNTLEDAWEIMRFVGCRHVPILENGQLKGIVSDRDVLLHAETKDHERFVFATIALNDIMSTNLVTCMTSDSVTSVVRKMLEHKIDSLPVLDENDNFSGIVTSTDLLNLLIERDSYDSKTLPFIYDLCGYRNGAQIV